MALRAKRTGIARPTFTDLPIMFKDGNPKPIPGYKARMDAARTMYPVSYTHLVGYMSFYERFFAQHKAFVLKIAIFFIYLLII